MPSNPLGNFLALGNRTDFLAPSMGNEFVKPKFEGSRFNQHSLPLDVAGDLFAYEEMVRELAAHLWRQAHPNRRLPKRFESNFDLHIERIDPGCSIPVLSLMAAAGLAFASPDQTYFTDARDLISEVIDSKTGSVPKNFPLNLLDGFKRFGKSLRNDEYVLIPRGDPSLPPARLDPAKRKALLKTANKKTVKSVTLEGSVGQIDWDRESFRLKMDDGTDSQIQADSLFFSSLQDLEKLGGNRRHRVSVSVVASFDVSGRISRVKEVKKIEVQQNFEIRTRLKELLEMEDGWLGDGTKAPKIGVNQLFFSEMGAKYPSQARMPAIFPTADGHFLLEWDTEEDPSLEIPPDRQVAFFSTLEDDDDQEFPISTAEEIRTLFSFLSQKIQETK